MFLDNYNEFGDQINRSVEIQEEILDQVRPLNAKPNHLIR